MDETLSLSDRIEEVSYVRAYLATLVAGLVAVVGGALAFPRQVYDEFLWQYFWGPVYADAHGASCVERVGGETSIGCSTPGAVTAEPGYTVVSTATYAIVLVFALIGVILLLDRLDLEMDRRVFFALFPFMLFGGALRVVEDASVAMLDARGELAVPFPWSATIISPFIYVTVFAVVLASLVAAVYAERRGVVDAYHRLLAAVGAVALAVPVLALSYLSATTDVLGFYPTVPAVVFGGATLIAALFWILSERVAPTINEATGFMGALIVWGHSVDGIANVLSLDWADALGLPITYGSKHVANRAIRDLTRSIQPESLSAAIGVTWPFLLVKVAVAIFVVWIFNDEIFEDSPRYALLILVAVLAVGLGPGTRDTLRATFGI
ncbi:hypothetical protein BRC81_02715 [Halobacteriales archaeon QS_1_68_20]|nr:MAG: hypothetical protein BRC81_02715 [Halobacteriales archaeon QS_1_68_20]